MTQTHSTLLRSKLASLVLQAAVACGVYAGVTSASLASVQDGPSLPSAGNPLVLTHADDDTAERSQLSDEEYSSYSGIGAIACMLPNGQERTATAFLVGAFDVAVTVAHTFNDQGQSVAPSQCVYTSTDSLGQIRERIPLSYVKSEWAADARNIGKLDTDLAVVRLTQRSSFAHRTLPLGKFPGRSSAVMMIGLDQGLDGDTVKRKSSGTAFAQKARKAKSLPGGIFTHDMDSRGIAPGAPVIDAATGVIIGVHDRYPSSDFSPSYASTNESQITTQQAAAPVNAIIPMNAWLEKTLRAELQMKE
jgi:hypothetical protein